MDREFLDANVLWSSAYNPRARISELWRLKSTILITSRLAAEEARRNMEDADQRERLAALLIALTLIEDVKQKVPQAIQLAAKDQHILAAAIASRATHLLTGDKEHFKDLFGRSVSGVLVLRPGDYLAMRQA